MGKRYQDNINGLLDALGDYMNRAEITETRCKFCGSTEIVKNGSRKGRQYWLCKRCGKGFVDNKAIPGMRYPTENIGSALWQFYTGASLNDIRGYIEQHTGNRPCRRRHTPAKYLLCSDPAIFFQYCQRRRTLHRPLC